VTIKEVLDARCESKVIHRIGNWYKLNEDYALLAQVNLGMCSLISLEEGNGYCSPVRVENVCHITDAELERMRWRDSCYPVFVCGPQGS